MTRDYANLMQEHPLYDKLKGHYTYLFNSYSGGDRYQKSGYLTRYAYESEIDYHERLRQTPLDNHCKSVVDIYNAFLFRKSIEREYGALEDDPALEAFLEDCDLEGRKLANFMKLVSTYASVFGHAHIVLAKPNSQARTRAEELEQSIRPYASVITPMAVLDWHYSREENGVYFLDYFKYIEDQEYKTRTVVKEWRPDLIRTYTVDGERQEIEEISEDENQLGEIPVVTVFSQKSIYRGMGISDIQDIADQQRAIYNELSEVEQAIRLNGHPSLVKTPTTEAIAGAGSIVQMPEDMDPGLKPYILESSANVESIYTSIQKRVESIDRMSNTGSVRQREQKTLSGVAMEVEFSMLNARLAEKADNLELAEEQMWRLFARYQGQRWQGNVKYPDTFSIRDDDRLYTQLKIARETTDSPRLVDKINDQLADLMGVELEEELTHATTIPGSDRSSHIQAMIMEGYTDSQMLALHPEITQQDIDSAKQELLDSGSE